MTNNDPAKTAPEQEKPEKKEKLRQMLLHAVTHNWGWKLGSIALAVCLWGILITQDTSLPREKVIEGVRVTVTNAAALRTNGLIVVGGLENVDTVNLRVSVPQKNYTAASAANYTARLDLSQLQTTGEQTLKITASTSSTSQYGTVVEVLSPEVTVTVEEYDTVLQLPVEVRLTGTMPSEYYGGAVSRSVESVDVSGPVSVVEKAVRCVVDYDQSELSPERSPNAVSLPFYFEDAQGNVLDGANLSVSPHGQGASITRITVRQDVYYLARVPVNTDALVIGQPAEGYAVSSVRVLPGTVTLGGSRVAIAPYLSEDAALYTYDQVDISGKSSTVTQLLSLNTPGNVDYISNTTVQVIVTIVPQEFAGVASGAAQNAGQTP